MTAAYARAIVTGLMGTPIEINDTLQITHEQGFPADVLNLERHRRTPITLDAIGSLVFSFREKQGIRMFQLDPVRVYLVENIEGAWLFWGHAFVTSQLIEKKLAADGTWAGLWVTSGTFIVSRIYEPAYQETFTRRESPPGKSFFTP